jgi:hypothetical protein
VNLSHRVGIHIRANAPVVNGQNPRAMAEPGLNLFLQDVLPDMSIIMVYVSFHHKSSNSDFVDHPVSMADLNLQPIDLLYMIDTNSEQAMTALDDCIVNYILNSVFPSSSGSDQPPRPDTDINITYFKATEDDHVSIFELAPLIGHLKSIILNSRALMAGDVIGSDEAGQGVDSNQFLDKERIDAAMRFIHTDTYAELINQTPKAYLDSYVLALTDSLGVGGEDDETIVSNIDDTIDAYLKLLKILSLVGLPQTGTGFITQWRKTQLSLLFKKVYDLIDTWNEKELQYNTVLGDYDPAAEDAMDLLLKAERIISTQTTLDPGNDPETFRTGILASKLSDFQQKRDDDFQNFVDENYLKISDALTASQSVLSYESFYLVATRAFLRIVLFGCNRYR